MTIVPSGLGRDASILAEELLRGRYTWKTNAYDMAGNFDISAAKKLIVK